MEREWGESKRNNGLKASQSQSIMRDTAKWPKGGVVTPLESLLFISIRRFVFLLVSRSTTTHFSLCFLCFYFDVLLQFVRPANAFDTGNYLHAVRGSNKLINAYMPSAQQSGPQWLKTRRLCVDCRLKKIDCGAKLNTIWLLGLFYCCFYGSFASGSCCCCGSFVINSSATTCGLEASLATWAGCLKWDTLGYSPWLCDFWLGFELLNGRRFEHY